MYFIIPPQKFIHPCCVFFSHNFMS